MERDRKKREKVRVTEREGENGEQKEGFLKNINNFCRPIIITMESVGMWRGEGR